MNRQEFVNAKRIVIKLGTNTLRNENGEVSLPRIYSYIEDIAQLVNNGKEVILVTSGAVGLGRKKINLEKTSDIVEKQACAAIGQCTLMSLYEDGFDSYNVTTAQILLTEDDFSQRKRYLNLRNTLNKLLELKVLPIINQNDTVSTVELDEIYQDMQVCFSDNDKLSALVTSEMDADLLIILSDVDGLFDSTPKENPNAKSITEVKEVTDSNKYTLRKFDIVTLSSDKTLTLEDTPATITVGEDTTSDILEVALLNTDRTTKQVVTETATCAGKTVTLSSGTAGDLYRVVYNTEKTTGQVYLDEANSFSDTVSLYLKFLGHDACKTKDLTLYVKIPQFDFNGSFSMSGSDGKPATMKIDGSAVKSICGGNKVFAEWYVE